MLTVAVYGQIKVISIAEAVRYIGYPPVEVGGTLKKFGFEQIQDIGHPW